MARDVEFDTVAHDRTGPGLSSTERAFKASAERIKREQERANKAWTKGLVDTVGAVSPKLAAQLSSGIAAGAGKAAPLLGSALAAGIAVGSPLIAASLSAAITGGVGAGVAGIGIAIAAQDARVQAAADQVWTKFENRALSAAGVFVQPAIDGVHQLGEAVNALDLEGIFRDAARYVDPLVDAASQFVRYIGDAVADLTANAGPAVRAIADGIVLIGKELGEGLSSLSDDGEDAAAALSLLFSIIGSSIDQIFMVVNGLTELYGIARAIGATTALELFFKATGKNAADADGSVRRLGGGTFGTAAVMRSATADAESYAQELERTEREARDARQAHMDLFGALTSVGEAMDRARAAARQNGRTLDENTEKGRANRQALSGLAGALRQQYDATVAVNGVGARSAQVAETNRQRFVAMARQMGLSSTQANRLARQLGLVPTKKEIDIRAQTAEAERRLKRAREMMAQLQSKTISVNVIVNERRIRKVQNQLERAGRDFAGIGSWAAAAPGSGGGRTDPPTMIDVALNNTIMLDGAPVRAYTDRAVAAAERRRRWRTKVRTV